VTRDKRKWTQTPADPYYSGKLLLPSFGIEVTRIEVTRSAPRTEVYLAGEGTEDLTCDSGDAFSISYLGPRGDATTVDRGFMGLDPAYIRRVLLRILDGEEDDDILLHYAYRDRREVRPGVPKGKRLDLRDFRKVEDPDPKAQVRITDLRLAKDLRPLELKSGLKAEVPELRLPFTTDDILRWKWERLREPKHTVSEEERPRTLAISFAAAALCLSVDLGLEFPEESSDDDLTEIILSWHTLIVDLISALDKAVNGASKLLAGRKGTIGGRPTDPQLKFYTALVLYRMGRFPDDIARKIGLSAPTPPEEREGGIAQERFNDNWKNKLYKAIEKGIEIEQEKFPRAAEVFARRNEKKVREAARAAYDTYSEPTGPKNVSAELEDGGDLVGMQANDTEQMQKAMIQLGSCIKWGRDPLSPNLD
jgi:hypothetical protein